MAPPRTGTTQIQVRFPPALLAAVDASIAGQSLPLSRPEEIRRLVKERLGEPAPAPAAPSEDAAEIRSRLVDLAGKVDGLIAYAREVEAQRDALAARPRLEIVRQPLRAFSTVERWPAHPGRGDPESVARARRQLAEAEARAEARRREESAAPQD
jgi:hypothetical protein